MNGNFSRVSFFALLAAVILLAAVSPHAAPAQARYAHHENALAYIGSDGNVYLLDSLDGEPIALTHDASRRRHYQWPTWSSDGRLAFFAHQAVGGGIRLLVYILPPDDLTPVLAYQSDTETLTYAYWSPANCDNSPACRDLALLTTTRQGLTVVRIRDEAPDFSVETLGAGGPFYYTYSPDGTRMLWQRFGAQLDLFDTTRNRIVERLPDRVGLFQAPMWSPIDDRLLFAVLTSGNRQDLVVADGEERQVLAADQDGVLWFSWSPDGEYVAYKLEQGALHVVDADTGEEVTESGFPGVLAFFWSPDGEHIAYLTFSRQDEDGPQVRPANGKNADSNGIGPVQQGELPVLAWRVLDVPGGREHSHARFIPSRDMIYLIAFFDQFAQSHRVWSPDSRYLVYSELLDLDLGGRLALSVIDVTDPGAAPREVAEGEIGVWSFE